MGAGRLPVSAKAIVVAGGVDRDARAPPALGLRREASPPRRGLHLPSGAHPRRRARPPDHERRRPPEELLPRPRRRGGVRPRDVHVLPVHDRQEPDRLRRPPQRADAGVPAAADDPRPRLRQGGPRQPRHRRRRTASRSSTTRSRRETVAGARPGDARRRADLLRGRRPARPRALGRPAAPRARGSRRRSTPGSTSGTSRPGRSPSRPRT